MLVTCTTFLDLRPEKYVVGLKPSASNRTFTDEMADVILYCALYHRTVLITALGSDKCRNAV